MDANFVLRTLAHNAHAAVPRGLVQVQMPHLRQDFRQRFGRAAGGVFFQAMMHLHHFQIKARTGNVSAALRIRRRTAW